MAKIWEEKIFCFKLCREFFFNCKHAKPFVLLYKWQNQCALCHKWPSCISSGKLISAYRSVFLDDLQVSNVNVFPPCGIFKEF
jgi:hypothetical protein